MKLRRLLVILGLIGLGVIIITNLGDGQKFIQALIHMHWYVVPLVVVIQIASYYLNTRYYESFFKLSSQEVNRRRLFEASLAINFANQVIPGGVAATTYFAQAVKPAASAATATLAQIGRYVFTYSSYFFVLAAGFLLLTIGGDLNKNSVRFIIILMVIILGLGLLLFSNLSHRSRLEKALEPVVRVINKISRKLRRTNAISADKINGFLDDFYEGYHLIMHQKGKWPILLGWSLLYNLVEVATIYAVFIGAGQWINPGIVITAYTLAIMASVLGIFTGGVGVYEMGMVGAFAALGIPFALSVTIVLVYRVLGLVFFLPPGLYYYRRHLKERGA